MSDVLARIVEVKREHVAARRRERSAAHLQAMAGNMPKPRGFAAALAAAAGPGRPALIAEIKKASPSKGLIRADFDPASLARAYLAGGATCLSVLTDTPFFQGRDDDLLAAQSAVPLPVLRKDFTIDPYQVLEARALGADCVLLIMACVDDGRASELLAVALELGLDVLVEVHDAVELDRALSLRPALIGINNRDLKTLKVDLATTERLAGLVPPATLLVAESGIDGPGDVARMAAAGARALLVGESLMRQADVTAATRRLLGLVAA
jgi:indole-3-glycerol phosphate synthase